MNKNISNEIINTLRQIIPNPKCELDFKNNYELLCCVMLSAQTTDKRVNIVTKELFEKYPNPYELQKANYNDIIEIIKSVGLASTKARNLIGIANRLCQDYNGNVPSTIEELTSFPGVGRKTANVVLALGFNIPTIPVDTHLHRMAKRLGYIKENDDVFIAEERFKKYIPKNNWIEAHHLFLLFGRYYCKAINPICNECLLREYCKYKNKA
ncbi:MAG: endonuclease III [Anaeroplasma sp.]